jgi:hypothetical protein
LTPAAKEYVQNKIQQDTGNALIQFTTWADVVTALQGRSDGEVAGLRFAGHPSFALGQIGPIKTSAGVYGHHNLDGEAVALIQTKLAPEAVVVWHACSTAQRNHGADAMQQLANLLGHPVLANWGRAYPSGLGASFEVRFDPAS